jgi:hypothetical protein
MGYRLEGRLLEVCTCKILCPCWVVEDPDFGTCDGRLCWHVDKGTVDGVDVDGHTLAILGHIPGNIPERQLARPGLRRRRRQPEAEGCVAERLDGQAGRTGRRSGEAGGEAVSVEQVPIAFDIAGASGTIKIGTGIEAELAPFQGATGKATAMHDTIFTTIPGSPAFMGKASSYHAKVPGFDIDLQGHNAVSASFRFAA